MNNFIDIATISPNSGTPGDSVSVSIYVSSQSIFTNANGGVPLRLLHQEDHSVINIPNFVMSNWDGSKFDTYFNIPDSATTGDYFLEVQYDNINWNLLADYAFNVYVVGCMDSSAFNYNPNATINQDSLFLNFFMKN